MKETISKLDLLDMWDSKLHKNLHRFMHINMNPKFKSREDIPQLRANGKIVNVSSIIYHYSIDEVISLLQSMIDNPKIRHRSNIPTWLEYIDILNEFKNASSS